MDRELYEKESERIFRQAQTAMANEDYDEVKKLGDLLIERGFSGGWEMKAQALSHTGMKKSAVQTLQELLNLEISYAKTPDQKVQAQARHIRLLIRAELFETIPWLIERGWGLPADDILGFAADECLKLKFKTQGKRFALDAARRTREDSFFWYIREADSLYSEHTKMWKLLVSGTNQDGSTDTLEYHVASDDKEQALRFVKEVEGQLSDIQVSEILSEEARSELPWGAYWRG